MAENLQKENHCANCTLSFPQALLSDRGWCSTCEKSDQIRFCKNEFCNMPLPKGFSGVACEKCRAKRDAKFVSREAFDTALQRQEEQFRAMQAQTLLQIKEMLSQKEPQLPPIPPKPQRPQPQREMIEEGEIPEDTISVRCGSDTMFQDDESVDQDDSVSQVESSITDDTQSTDQQEFVRLIRKLAGEPEEEEQSDTDALHRMFASFKNKKEEALPLPLSQLQKDVLLKYLQPKRFTTVCSKNIELLQLNKENQSFFKTPTPNPGLVEFIGAKRQADPKCLGSDKKKVFTNNSIKSCENALFQIDRTARAGAKTAVYGQWLLAVLKDTIMKDTGEEIPADSATGKILDELMNISIQSLVQSCRTTTISVTERRRLYLDELGLSKWPLEAAQKLPTDTTGTFLFGKGIDEKGEAVTIDSIVESFSERYKSVRTSAPAFRMPFAPSNKSNKRQQNPPKSQKRQNENKSNWQNKSNKKGRGDYKSQYKPFSTAPATQGGYSGRK